MSLRASHQGGPKKLIINCSRQCPVARVSKTLVKALFVRAAQYNIEWLQSGRPGTS